MDDNSELCATQRSEQSLSDDDSSLDSSSYDDGLDYSPLAPSVPRPVASRVPHIGRLPLGGISGGAPRAGLQLNLGRCVVNATEATGQPSISKNDREGSFGPRETSTAIDRERDVQPRIPQCETPTGFVKPSKLTLSRPSEDLMGGNDYGAVPGRDNSTNVTVSLLSHGLALDRLAAAGTPLSGSELAKALHSRVSKSMGVKMEELTWFEVRPLDLSTVQLAEGCQLAVAVNRSGFSLAALEDLLLENKQLASTAEKSASSLESMQSLMREHMQALRKGEVRVAEQDAELRRLQERCRALEREINTLRFQLPESVDQIGSRGGIPGRESHLRMQLQRSDGLRLQGQHALDELKQEFEALTRDLAAEPLSSWPSAIPSHQMSLGQSSAINVEQLLGTASSDRLTNVLSRLCEESVLRRLEGCLGGCSGN
eukprot:jgi/Botrbrau1/3579/Bobra.0078s0033.1